jgi:hypothetical protein
MTTVSPQQYKNLSCARVGGQANCRCTRENSC